MILSASRKLRNNEATSKSWRGKEVCHLNSSITGLLRNPGLLLEAKPEFCMSIHCTNQMSQKPSVESLAAAAALLEAV